MLFFSLVLRLLFQKLYTLSFEILNTKLSWLNKGDSRYGFGWKNNLEGVCEFIDVLLRPVKKKIP